MNANTLKINLKTIVLFIVISLVACNDSSYKESLITNDVEITDRFSAVAAENVKEKGGLNAPESPKDLKIIKSANVRYKVNNVVKSTKQIKRIAERYNAYVSDQRFTNDLYKKENRFTLKVPQNNFDKVMDSVKHVVDFVEYENITTKDVTEEYIDIESRLKTKLEVKKRYESILRNNAKSVEDILMTEEKLRILQEEIESAQGRLKYLTNKVSYSTIQIDLYETVEFEEEPVSYKKSFWDNTKEGLVNGLSLIENIIITLLNIWPLVIMGLIIFFTIKNRFRKSS